MSLLKTVILSVGLFGSIFCSSLVCALLSAVALTLHPHPLHSILGQPADPWCVAASGLVVPDCSQPGSVGGKRSPWHPYNGQPAASFYPHPFFNFLFRALSGTESPQSLYTLINVLVINAFWRATKVFDLALSMFPRVLGGLSVLTSCCTGQLGCVCFS